jgi:sulfoxide reductase heme-binding subunit YedZ
VIKTILMSKWTKVVVFLASLIPLGILVWLGFHNQLTANPIEFITHWTGDWTMRFLILSLAITPLRKILKQPLLIRYRRMLGLFAFFYVCLHFATWIGLDKFFNWPEMMKDVAKRRFITVGFAGFVLLVPLAVTSTAGWIRRLGGKRWQLLHRLVYVTAILGVIHYWWLVKSDIHKPLQYAVIVGLLLLWRVADWIVQRPTKVATNTAARREAPVRAETA